MPLSDDERRALALIAALLLLAGAARWLERPRSILDDVPDVDVAALEQASRAAHDERAVADRPRRRASSRAPPPAAATAATPPAVRGASGYTAGERIDPKPAQPVPIDLNAATAEQLEDISGIGPAIAARIVARRDSIGRFQSYAQLDSVRGIGPALLARIQAASVIR